MSPLQNTKEVTDARQEGGASMTGQKPEGFSSPINQKSQTMVQAFRSPPPYAEVRFSIWDV